MKNLLVKAGILNEGSSNSEVVRESKAILTSIGLKPDLVKYQKQLKDVLDSKIANNKVKQVVEKISKTGSTEDTKVTLDRQDKKSFKVAEKK